MAVHHTTAAPRQLHFYQECNKLIDISNVKGLYIISSFMKTLAEWDVNVPKYISLKH